MVSGSEISILTEGSWIWEIKLCCVLPSYVEGKPTSRRTGNHGIKIDRIKKVTKPQIKKVEGCHRKDNSDKIKRKKEQTGVLKLILLCPELLRLNLKSYLKLRNPLYGQSACLPQDNVRLEWISALILPLTVQNPNTSGYSVEKYSID